MASNINTVDIDAQYPVAGVDNDSQGFRDNFSTIKNNFVAAKGEIETLQDETVKLNADNDFNGNKIQEADFLKNTEVTYNIGAVSNSLNISFNNGHYQTLTATESVTLSLADWPATGKLGKIRVVLKTNNTDPGATITWATDGAGTIKNDGAAIWSDFTLTSTDEDTIVDFWTDGGLIVYASYVGTFTV